jgi:hypothetical protein
MVGGRINGRCFFHFSLYYATVRLAADSSEMEVGC